MSFQISVISDNASSRPQFSRDRSFAFGNFEVREDAPLAADTRSEVSAAGRDFLVNRLRRLKSELRS
jgi:hypothetical protein